MENMEAVKRAYAEMILKTAKEAAERVMAAELRARRKEEELVSAKEEAANMLLRLKQMVDAKTKEAEITSMNQKKKFEELESQLNEAEGIILDLREELNQGRERLDNLKKKQLQLEMQNQENVEDSLNTYAENESKNVAKIASSLEEETQHRNGESLSIVRRSQRKRKLKFWDDVMTVCGLQSSHHFTKMKKCVKHGEDTAEGRTQIESVDDAEVSKEVIHTETVPEKMELINVSVKQDELASTFELTSASRTDCDVGDDTVDDGGSNLGSKDDSKLCRYTFNRRWRKKSAVYPEKVLDGGSQDSSFFVTESAGPSG